MSERLSLTDDSLLAGHAENIQRFEFALEWCRGKRVLDAGCGSGYGAHFLGCNGAASVLGVDISAEAIDEARREYQRDNVRFEVRDLQRLDAGPLNEPEVIVNFETLPHLAEPRKFLEAARSQLAAGGTLITSAPNGELVKTDEHGKPLYRYQHRTYSIEEFKSLLAACFSDVTLHAHWLTHQGRLRNLRAQELFAQLVEAYYNPLARAGRAIKRMAGRQSAGPPIFRGGADSYAGDYALAPLASRAFPWPPTTLIAVCRI
ncbi:MAG TPA: class I SAM-dependent methyltransferase [Burkholderiales bacterium]|nr:class I SAM-dependent methyltransferase [Burkholderiales bacterium]